MKKEGFIKFQLGGVHQSCSIDEFGVALGLYKEEDLAGSHNLEILKDWTMVEARSLWRSISPPDSAYKSNQSKAAMIDVLILWFLHVLLRHTICQMVQSDWVIGAKDLFIFYNL